MHEFIAHTAYVFIQDLIKEQIFSLFNMTLYLALYFEIICDFYLYFWWCFLFLYQII